jgi:hypothetical protein
MRARKLAGEKAKKEKEEKKGGGASAAQVDAALQIAPPPDGGRNMAGKLLRAMVHAAASGQVLEAS